MKIKIASLATIALCASTLSAMQFQTLGYKSVGMGGASVASSSGSFAAYNNPALLAKSPYNVEVVLGGGVSYEDHGAGASVKALDDSNFLDTVDKVSDDLSKATDSDKANLIKGKNIIIGMDGDAVNLDPQVSIAAQVGSFGFGVFGSSNGVATAIVDQARDQLIFKDSTSPSQYAKLQDDGNIVASNLAEYEQSSLEYALNNDTTYLDVTGLAIAEVPLAYGHSFDIAGGNLMVGGAVKYMRGISYTEKYKIDNSGEVSGSEGKRDKTTNTFGIDLGLAYEPSFVKDLTIGLVGKNLNTPKFDVVDNGGEIKVKPLVRLGVAYDILASLEVAIDYDITANETLVADYKSQMLGGGLNWHPTTWFALRGGLMQNMDSSDKAGVIYTAGVGIGAKWLQLDISGQYSSNETTVDGTTLPEYAKINLALISRW
jgi:hypothetical protein